LGAGESHGCVADDRRYASGRGTINLSDCKRSQSSRRRDARLPASGCFEMGTPPTPW
jgi:hypothetical protein